MRNFTTKETKLMMEIFSLYVRSKIKYHYLVYSPIKQAEIDAVNVREFQKYFTIITGEMEPIDLKELELYNQYREKYI